MEFVDNEKNIGYHQIYPMTFDFSSDGLKTVT